MALRIGKLCGNGGRVWLALRDACVLDSAGRSMTAESAAIPTLEASRD